MLTRNIGQPFEPIQRVHETRVRLVQERPSRRRNAVQSIISSNLDSQDYFKSRRDKETVRPKYSLSELRLTQTESKHSPAETTGAKAASASTSADANSIPKIRFGVFKGRVTRSWAGKSRWNCPQGPAGSGHAKLTASSDRKEAVMMDDDEHVETMKSRFIPLQSNEHVVK